jgi:hypothetical protein
MPVKFQQTSPSTDNVRQHEKSAFVDETKLLPFFWPHPSSNYLFSGSLLISISFVAHNPIRFHQLIKS